MPQGFLRFVIVVFPDHTHLLFFRELSGNFSVGFKILACEHASV